MKKISRTIAMILILVILVSSFTGCATRRTESVGLNNNSITGIVLVGFMLLLFSVLLPIIYNAYAPVDNGERIAVLAQEEKSPFMDALDSLPEAELAALKKKLDALPKAELVSLSAAFNSLPEAERNSFIEKINSASETEIVSSIKKINAIPDEKFVSLINVLQHVEMDYSPSNNAVYFGFRFQY